MEFFNSKVDKIVDMFQSDRSDCDEELNFDEEFDAEFEGLKDYVMCTALRKNSTAASNCIGCGKCETHCPQHIEIRTELKNAAKGMEGFLYKTVRKFVEVFKAF